MERLKAFSVRKNFRLFKEEAIKMRKIVLHARDDGGFLKFESESHFVRSAIIRAIREEYSKLKVKKGRPKK